jgi:threonine synthase
MKYISTRGAAPEVDFRSAVVSGLAPDGGLYMPAEWPQISAERIAAFKGRPFAEVAADIIGLFAGDEITADELKIRAFRAYGAFDAPETAPLRPLGDDTYILELFHGPTLAFKDVAMRMLAELYDWALNGAVQGKTIIGATSGDTGGAAIHAFAGSAKTEVFMLHPKGRISDVQRRMMTTLEADNVFNIAVDGSFDDCQRIVKTLFSDHDLCAVIDLGGVNSINWVRLAVQTVYYFTATASLGAPASFIVPTGNFGDVFAGFAAKQMGLGVNKLGVAVNSNDIMRRVLATGEYAPASTVPTSSPSMDIQVASNFERLLYEASGRDGAKVSELMFSFEKNRRFTTPAAWLGAMQESFCADAATESAVSAKIKQVWSSDEYLIDPHTAVGLSVLDKLRARNAIAGPAVCLSTAHPAKFPDAVFAASGKRPDLPARYHDLHQRTEKMVDAPADADAIKHFIIERSRFRGRLSK